MTVGEHYCKRCEHNHGYEGRPYNCELHGRGIHTDHKQYPDGLQHLICDDFMGKQITIFDYFGDI